MLGVRKMTLGGWEVDLQLINSTGIWQNKINSIRTSESPINYDNRGYLLWDIVNLSNISDRQIIVIIITILKHQHKSSHLIKIVQEDSTLISPSIIKGSIPSKSLNQPSQSRQKKISRHKDSAEAAWFYLIHIKVSTISKMGK